MMPRDNIEVVRQHQMMVAWIRLREMKKLKETEPNGQLTSPYKNSKLLLIKILIIIKIIKMILLLIIIYIYIYIYIYE